MALKKSDEERRKGEGRDKKREYRKRERKRERESWERSWSRNGLTRATHTETQELYDTGRKSSPCTYSALTFSAFIKQASFLGTFFSGIFRV
jgi:hypothetical protein